MVRSNSSARWPILSLSSNEMPGRDDMLIVKEPSLNGGRKERPSVKKQASAITNRPIVPPNTLFLCPNTKVSAAPYHSFILRATGESPVERFSSFIFSLPSR